MDKLSVKNKTKGFTLIELMTIVVIVAILATIAYPSYQSFLIKTRREQAKATMMNYARNMERFYTKHRSFRPVGVATPTIESTNFHTITRGNLTHDGYTLTAKPKSNNPGDKMYINYSSTSQGFLLCTSDGLKCEVM